MSGNCEKTDLPPEMCSHCRGLDTKAEKWAASWQGPARYSGRLACDHHVREGDPIGRTADGDYVCDNCIEVDQ